MKWSFSEIYSEIKSDGYFFSVNGQQKKIFTERSLARELKILKEKADDSSKAEKILICVYPWHNFFSELLESKNIFFLSPFTYDTAGAFQVLCNQERVDYFINLVKKDAKFDVYFHQQLHDLPFLRTYVDEIFRKIATRIKTVDHFAARWEFNFRRNFRKYQNLSDILQYKGDKPDVFVLAGPQSDAFLHTLPGKKIWCADTALVPLLKKGLIPDLVFTLDAGHGSFEHFLNYNYQVQYEKLNIVADTLCFPQIFDLPFRKIYSYRNSYPPVSDLSYPVTELVNDSGDVCGLMKATYRKLYSSEFEAVLTGASLKHEFHVSHLRGSAYHRRLYLRGNRYYTVEMYLCSLSRRYA